MKQCNRCLIEKPLDEFHTHKNCFDGHLNQCRGCRNKWVSDYRSKLGGGNSARGISDEARRQKQRRRRQRFKQYRDEARSVPCADCGGVFPPVCMDFDHRPGTEKLFDVAAHGSVGGWDALKREIAKCDVVCACCHRLRTQRRMAATL